jgi:hypothetical protein
VGTAALRSRSVKTRVPGRLPSRTAETSKPAAASCAPCPTRVAYAPAEAVQRIAVRREITDTLYDLEDQIAAAKEKKASAPLLALHIQAQVEAQACRQHERRGLRIAGRDHQVIEARRQRLPGDRSPCIRPALDKGKAYAAGRRLGARSRSPPPVTRPATRRGSACGEASSGTPRRCMRRCMRAASSTAKQMPHRPRAALRRAARP